MMKNKYAGLAISFILMVCLSECSLRKNHQTSDFFNKYMLENFDQQADKSKIYVIITRNSCKNCINTFIETVNNAPSGSFTNVILVSSYKNIIERIRPESGFSLLHDHKRNIDYESVNLYNINCIKWDKEGKMTIEQVNDANDLLKLMNR